MPSPLFSIWRPDYLIELSLHDNFDINSIWCIGRRFRFFRHNPFESENERSQELELHVTRLVQCVSHSDSYKKKLWSQCRRVKRTYSLVILFPSSYISAAKIYFQSENTYTQCMYCLNNMHTVSIQCGVDQKRMTQLTRCNDTGRLIETFTL